MDGKLRAIHVIWIPATPAGISRSQAPAWECLPSSSAWWTSVSE